MSDFRCHRQSMRETRYIQTASKEFPSRKVRKYECVVCGSMKLRKDHVDARGKKFTRDIVVHEIAFPEWLEIQFECTEEHQESFKQKNLDVYGETKQNEDGTYEHVSKYMETDRKRATEYRGEGRIKEPVTEHTILVGI